MKILSLREFCTSKNFVEIHKSVRENTNGYPFVTFMDKNNKAENIYFTKSQSANFAEGMLLTPSIMKDLQIAVVKNAQGEERIKLCGKGESNRLSLDDLL